MMTTSKKTVWAWAGGVILPVVTAAVLVCWSAGSGSSAAPTGPEPGPRKPTGEVSFLAFKAKTIDGWEFNFIEVNARRRIIVFLFDPSGKGAASAARAAQRLYQDRHAHNMEVLGVMMPPALWATPPGELFGLSRLLAVARGWRTAMGATFPCVIDPAGAIANRYLGAAKVTDRNYRTTFFVFPRYARRTEGLSVGTYHARQSAEPEGFLYRSVLYQFGIEPTAGIEPLVGDYPKAPDAVLTDIKGKTHRLSSYRGDVVVLVFLMRTCPRCKIQLAYLEQMWKRYGPSARPSGAALRVLAVATDVVGEKLKKLVAERGYTFPVAGDSDWKIRGAFRFRGGVPDTFVIAPDATVRYRHRDHRGDLSTVLQMEIRTLLGLKTRPMLSATGYTGGRSCRVCHTEEHNDWTLTRHACAWETLVRMGKERDPKCVRCHVVGYGEKGAFESPRKTPHLVDVQCESCHGRSGCKAFTGRESPIVEGATCKKCHDAKHSPRFDFAAVRKYVLHDRAAALKKLPRDKRQKALKKLCSGTNRHLFNPDTPYVGSAACEKCHPISHEAVANGRHAKAIGLLKSAAADHWRVPPHKRGVVGLGKAECLRCHVTGFGQRGGFPAAVPADPLTHPMAGVGCEGCHGPGKAHVDDPKKPRAIAKLGGTCNECNVLPICRQCHDDRNSPRFHYPTALSGARHKFGKAKTP